MSHRVIKHFVCSEDVPVVQTKAGKLRGYIVNEMYTFLGIRYAEAERFKAPKPVTPWEGIVDAQDYGHQSPQTPPRLPDSNLAFPKRWWPESEHCQYLNVWTKQLDPAAKKPVMVWLHGGGFSSGSCVELECYDGENMSRYGDVVVVSLNHRLNILGFLDVSDYGDEYELSGNAGMEDIVVALQWIKDNIAQFGGDPDNVTIFGESGGGGKVCTLLQMGAADGLYAHAIIESGVHDGDESVTPAEEKAAAKASGRMFVEAAGGIEALSTMPYAKLLKLMSDVGRGGFMWWSPTPLTGSYIGSWHNAGFRDEVKDIPVIAGSVFQEMIPRPKSIADKNALSDEERLAAVAEAFGAENADAIAAAFKKAYPELNLFYASLVDHSCRMATGKYCAKRVAAGGTNTYNFMFAFETEFQGGHMSTHADELAFVFHNTEYIGAMYAGKDGEKTRKAQDEIFYAWINYARTGVPNHDGIPAWAPYGEERNCFVFSSDPRCVPAFDEELMALASANRKMDGRFGPARRLPKK